MEPPVCQGRPDSLALLGSLGSLEPLAKEGRTDRPATRDLQEPREAGATLEYKDLLASWALWVCLAKRAQRDLRANVENGVNVVTADSKGLWELLVLLVLKANRVQ